MPAALLAVLLLQTKFGASLEVRVVNLDVVVTDKAGHRVTGLTKDDFEVLEDGKRQTITNFDEERGIAAAAAAPGTTVEKAMANHRPRRFVIFVDNESMPVGVRRQFFASLRKFIDTQLLPGDQASLVVWSRNGLRFAAPLTSIKPLLRGAVDAAEASPAPASVRTGYERAREQCVRDLDLVRGQRMPVVSAYADCINSIRLDATVTVTDSRMLMNAMNVAMTVGAGAEGKKVLVFAGASLPQRPGDELYRWANMMFQQQMRGFDTANAQNHEDQQAQREMLERLAHSANAHGFSFYGINAPAAADSLDLRSVTAGQDLGTDFFRMDNTDSALASLAEMTGGIAFKHPVQFDAALGSIAGDLDSYYSIGYRPADDVARDRAVAVRTKNRDYVVRARQSYAPKSADEEMRDRVVANIYSPSTRSEWPVTIASGALQRGDRGTFSVPLEVSVPPTLTLLPEEGKLAGGFAVYIAVGNRQGALSTISRSVQPVAVPPAEEATFRKLPLSFAVNLTLKPGENLVSIAVADQVSHVAGFARTTIITPNTVHH